MNDKNKDEEKVIAFDKKRSEILKKKKQDERMQRNSSKQDPNAYFLGRNPIQNSSQNPPMFNIPNGTKYLLAILVGIHLLMTFIINNDLSQWIIYHLGFVPARFTNANMVEALQFITPITHMFLHGSWLHIGMNALMLLAFGSGLERWIGTKKMLQIFFMCGLFGVTTHLAFNLYSFDPVIGASGGLSGMFAAALVMLNRQGNMSGKYGIMPFVILWIGISILFGMMGSPDGSAIAWAAHIGGFLGGFVAVKLLKI